MDYDVIIIGTGAGGGTLAHTLAPTGKRILILERGDFLPREVENWEPRALFLEGRYDNAGPWRDAKGKSFTPGAHYFVGGNTKVYGAALIRLRERDFGELQHHGGVSPAWPLSYSDFQPHYLEAERLYSVHGERGADPTEPPESEPYPCPPISHEPRIAQVFDNLKLRGRQPFHLPVGIRLDESNPDRSQCIRCATCDGYPCMVHAKADAHTTCINPAIENPNVTLLTGAKATRLIADGRKVTHVELEHEGETKRVSANIIVSSCGAINSAALLLRSNLANSSGLVGRHYMCHNNSAIVAVSLTKNPTKFQKTIGCNDYYFGADDFDYPLGHIQLLGKAMKEMLKAGAPPLTPTSILDAMVRRSIDWWITSEDLPDPNNRVTLDSDGTIRLTYRENNMEPHRRLLKKLKEMAGRNLFLAKKIPLPGVAHQVGTCRFGTDPATSVLDTNCKAHDLDNLYVVDGSFFPSSAAVNPGLTIIANALRVGQHLRDAL
jgi:choline dehydrogenase-like flavoprotein